MPSSSSTTLLATAGAIEALPVRSESVDTDEPQTRQVLVRRAMDGLQRFKQSWKSVMLIKAGVGLGQVIVLVVLLILANTLSSPLFPSLTQSQPSDACPHPHLFQAWMGVQIARLTVCWSVSCWMCIRTERRRRRRRAEREAEEREESAVQPEPRPSVQIRRIGLTRNPDSFSSRVTPSLIHSSASTSTLIITQPSVPSTPDMSRSSSSRLDLTCVVELDHIPDSPDQLRRPSESQSRKRSRSRERSTGTSRISDDHLFPPPAAAVQLRERQSMRSLRQARGMLHGEAAPVSADAPAGGFPGWLDRHAMSISRTLGIFSTVLFLLGNVLLFYPTPSDFSCYAANPLLWWGVLTVTAIGWVLLLQVFSVVVIVGLGGAVVLNALQRLGVIPAPAEPEQPRAAQPDPLTPTELAQIKVVCYLPESSKLAVTRLPFPPVYLSPHQSTCAICQESFGEPKEGRTILLKADKLRQLGCSHVYHMSCIDQWLLKGSGNCPSCNAPVRPSLQASTTATASTPRTPRTTRRNRRGENPGSPV